MKHSDRVATENGYDFYVADSIAGRIFNIVPTKSMPPAAGYLFHSSIENIKGVKFPPDTLPKEN